MPLLENRPKKPVVLAVDDIEANLIALEAVLSSEYHLVFAHSGEEALQILGKRDDVDVILMDLQMPGLDGYQTAVEMKKMKSASEIPIVFITAIYKEDPFIKKGYEAGAVDYFSKPFDPEILKLKLGIYSAFRQKASVLRERENQIRESEELLKAGRKLSSILETLAVGVLISDVQGRICQTNEAVARILNAGSVAETDEYGALLGWWDRDGQLIRDHHGPLQRAIQSGKASHNELIQIRCVDGGEKTILGSVSPLHAQDGHIVGAVVVIQDVTETRKIEIELEKRITNLVSLGVEFEHEARLGHG